MGKEPSMSPGTEGSSDEVSRVRYGFIHLQLCKVDGDRFLADFLKSHRKLIIVACARTCGPDAIAFPEKSATTVQIKQIRTEVKESEYVLCHPSL